MLFFGLVSQSLLGVDRPGLPENPVEILTGAMILLSGGDQIVVAVDTIKDGVQDGQVDDLLLFQMDSPLAEPLVFETLQAQVELFEGSVLLLMPRENKAFELSLSRAGPKRERARRGAMRMPALRTPGLDLSDPTTVGFQVTRLGNGVGLVHQSGGFQGLVLSASELSGWLSRFTPLWEDQQQEPNPGGPGGGCASGCSVSCPGAGSCSASCGSGYCAVCLCSGTNTPICHCQARR